jgi:hypothetical protein
LKYCNTWNEYFGNESRILHIIRHPVDVAFSVWKKRGRGSIDGPLKMYCNRMPKIIPALKNTKNVMTFKYEDVLINPDEILPEIFKFCGLKDDIKFRKYLNQYENPKYKNLDSSRAFAYKRGKVKIKRDMSRAIQSANIIKGPKYEVVR